MVTKREREKGKVNNKFFFSFSFIFPFFHYFSSQPHLDSYFRESRAEKEWKKGKRKGIEKWETNRETDDTKFQSSICFSVPNFSISFSSSFTLVFLSFISLETPFGFPINERTNVKTGREGKEKRKRKVK